MPWAEEKPRIAFRKAPSLQEPGKPVKAGGYAYDEEQNWAFVMSS